LSAVSYLFPAGREQRISYQGRQGSTLVVALRHDWLKGGAAAVLRAKAQAGAC
jgi:hypothetical protein